MSLLIDNRATVLYFDSNKTEDKVTEHTIIFLYYQEVNLSTSLSFPEANDWINNILILVETGIM